MIKLKKINSKYIIVVMLLVLGLTTVFINTSYGLFKKTDHLTDINFIVGTLDYKIENSNLVENSINVNAGEEYKLVLNLTSLNPIDSKYELYYLIDGKKVTSNDIEIGYTEESIDSVKGTINANKSKSITVSIKNNGTKAVTITLGCEGGLINNELVMSLGNSLDNLILADDLIVAYTYVGDENAPERFPNKGEGYIIKSVTCNGMDAEWNNATWSLTFSNVTGKNITCNFEIDSGELLTEHIIALSETNTDELRIDYHAATGQQNFNTTEYRYWGATPNNYVWFNEELWRIIGVFDVDDGSAGSGGTGKIEKRVKIIRNENIGDYVWDTSDSSTNAGTGINEWSQADLMTLLNSGAYYNNTTGTCYVGRYNATSPCDFSKTGLASEAKEIIGNAKWYLGAHTTNEIITVDMYKYERGFTLGKQCSGGNTCNDSVKRTYSWIGKIGLLYPSDYGYSSNIESCHSTNLINFSNTCKNSSWLYNNSNFFQCTISPSAFPNYSSDIFAINNAGAISIPDADNVFSIRPVVYLLPGIKIVDGIGTEQQPFIISK